MQFMRAGSLPTEVRELRHAASMPITFDKTSDRPFCCGLWKTQQLVGLIFGVVLCTLCWAWRPIVAYDKANSMLGIASLCGSFWVFEVVPIYITALFPMVLLPLCEITSSNVVAQSYWNDTQMLFIAMYLVDIALEEVKLPEMLALKLLLKVGAVKPWTLLFGAMTVSWFLSMFINTIAVVLMITPIAMSLMNATEEVARNQGIEEGAESEASSSAASSVSAEDAQGVREVQLYSRGLLLGIAYASTAGGMATLTGSIPNRILVGLPLVAYEITWLKWFAFALPMSLVTYLLAFGVIWTRYVRHVRCMAIRVEHLESEYDAVCGDAGCRDPVLVGILHFLQILGLILYTPCIAQLFTTKYGVPLASDAVVATIPAVALFFIPSERRRGETVLTWTAVHETLDFGVLLLIGGGFAMSKGFSESGLDQVVGAGFAHATASMSALSVTILVLLLGSVGTQLFSAVGCATTLLPMLNAASLEAVVNPLRMALPGAISCSLAFMLPTATPANVIALAKSQDSSKPLQVRDFVLSGLPLNLAGIVVCSIIATFWGQVVFQSTSPFPLSSCGGTATNCVFLQIPGDVQNMDVDSQACMLLDTTSDTKCKLWNGTIVTVLDYPNAGSYVPEPEAEAPEPEPESGAAPDPVPVRLLA